jgi:hypothetical protein
MGKPLGITRPICSDVDASWTMLSKSLNDPLEGRYPVEPEQKYRRGVHGGSV